MSSPGGNMNFRILAKLVLKNSERTLANCQSSGLFPPLAIALVLSPGEW